MKEIREIVLAKFPNVDVRYLDRYLSFIAKYRLAAKERYSERHHILPKSSDCFPEYSSFRDHPWNSAILCLRAHYLAHWMCAKIFGGKQWLAFNQMRRVIQGENRNRSSRLYESARKYISDESSKINTGKVRDATFRQMCSERVIGTVIVRHKDSLPGSKCLRISKDSEEYRSGDWIPNTCGRILSENTRRKMSENNGLRDKNEYHNPFTMERGYYSREDIIPEGFILGAMPNSRAHVTENLSDTEWWHDPILKKNYRLSQGDDTSGLVRGRYSFDNKGFEKINDCNLIRVYDLRTGINGVVLRSDVSEWHTTKKQKSKLLRFKNYVVDTEACEVFTESFLDSPMKPHNNQAIVRREFFKKHRGKTLRELGFDIVLVKDYVYTEGDVYVRVDGNFVNEYRNAVREIEVSRTASS